MSIFGYPMDKLKFSSNTSSNENRTQQASPHHPHISAHTVSAFVSCLAVETSILVGDYSSVENSVTSLPGMSGCGCLSVF